MSYDERGEAEQDAEERGEEDEDGLEVAAGEPVKGRSDEVESDLWGGDGTGAGVRVEEGGGSLFDDRAGVGVVDPFVDMEGEVVVVLEMGQQRHEKREAEEYEKQKCCFVF